MCEVSTSPASTIEHAIGYSFRDVCLRDAALTHRSYRFECREEHQDNQRLEFLGDAVLGLLLADWAYRHYAEHPEGALTVLRSRLASTAALASIARSLQLGLFLRLGRGEAASGGAERDGNLADALEALFAAVYLDGGLAAAENVFRHIFGNRMDSLDDNLWADNPKGRLQQWAQREYHVAPDYFVIHEDGPPHQRSFHIGVRIGDAWQAEGDGSSKQSAQTAAAQALIDKIQAHTNNS